MRSASSAALVTGSQGQLRASVGSGLGPGVPEGTAVAASRFSGSGAKPRSRRLLVTTNTELNAIAAPAIIGLSSPAAASGSAATL